ncbi:VOC family protein [Massilia sp. DD77]|uniref:VOC family protein n=1 Tax=Massilia sp. DD77 TaxID=3109349 RepID=UPI002FFF0ADE
MFDHVKIGVSDFAASRDFYAKVLAPLGIAIVAEGEPSYGVELCGDGPVSFCLFQATEKPAHLHLAFAAATRAQVDAFHRAALDAGARDNGAPGLRPQYNATYYAAFVIDPDGHNIEAVTHAPAA